MKPDRRTVAHWHNLTRLALTSGQAGLEDLRRGQTARGIRQIEDAIGRLRTIHDALAPHDPTERR